MDETLICTTIVQILPVVSDVATLGPTGALALPSASSVAPDIKILAYHVMPV